MRRTSIFSTIRLIAFMLLLALAFLAVYASETKVSEPEPEHEHTFIEEWTVVEPATKEAEGLESNVCADCGEAVTRSIEKLHVHSFAEDWTVEKAPTTEELGIESNVCHVCQNTIKRKISKLEVVNIFITKQPSITSYYTGEKFNTHGMVVTAVLDNGETVTVKDYELVTSNALTSSVTQAKIKYGEFTATVPIYVSPATFVYVDKIDTLNVGTLVFTEGICIGNSTTAAGEKQNIIKDLSTNKCVLLTGANYNYNVGDRISFFATISASNGERYLKYSRDNKSIASTIVATNAFIDFRFDEKLSVSSTDEMQDAFTGGISQLDVVKFNGLFYIIKDGPDYIVHFNESASGINDVKLNSNKTVRISTENIDDSLLSARLPFDSTAEYPGVLVNGTLTAFYTYSDSDNIYLDVLSNDWVVVDYYVDAHKYLTEVAYAFYYQLPYVDYDQYHSRRNINPSPEDATAEQRIYLDCSSYVNAIYYNSFGVNVLPYEIKTKTASTANFTAYAKGNPDAVDVIGYWETADYPTVEAQEKLLDELKNGLQVGDVIVYRKESSGHTLIYVGGGKFLHCMNTTSFVRHPDKDKTSNPTVDPLLSYDVVSSSSVGFETVENLFNNKSASRYLFSKNYVNFSILRPLNRGLTATAQAEARMTIPGLSIEKSSSAHMFAAVFTGDEITYTITLKNNKSYAMSDVNLLEKIPAGTEFVSASEGVSHENGAITWSGSVEAKETVTLSFTVKVTETTTGATIESCEGTVNGLELNKITNTVSAISKEKLEELSDIGYGKAESSAEYTDPILMIKDVYNELLGEDVFDYTTVAEALADIIDLENKKYNESCDVSDMVISNLTGGYLIRGTNPHNNDRIRAVRIEYMSVGDVIIAEHVSTSDVQVYTAYIYLGENDFLAITSESGTASVTECKAPELTKIQNILASLYSYDKYAVIRPSMKFTAQ